MLDFDVLTAALFGIIGVAVIIGLKVIKHKSVEYLIVFGFLYVYLILVVKYTIFPIMYDSVFTKIFAENSVKINLIPFAGLSLEDFREPFLNILLFVPFGFLMSIFLKPNYKRGIVWALVLSVVIELLQFNIAYITRVYFRVTDINDVIFNTLGAVIGILLYLLLRFVMRKILKERNLSEAKFLKFVLS